MYRPELQLRKTPQTPPGRNTTMGTNARPVPPADPTDPAGGRISIEPDAWLDQRTGNTLDPLPAPLGDFDNRLRDANKGVEEPLSPIVAADLYVTARAQTQWNLVPYATLAPADN